MRFIFSVLFLLPLHLSAETALEKQARYDYEIPSNIKYKWEAKGQKFFCSKIDTKTGVVDKGPYSCPIVTNCKYTLHKEMFFTFSSSAVDPFTKSEMFPNKQLSSNDHKYDSSAESLAHRACEVMKPSIYVKNKNNECFGHNYKVMTDTQDPETGYLRYIKQNYCGSETSHIIKTHFTRSPKLRKSEQGLFTQIFQNNTLCYEVDDHTGGLLYAKVAGVLDQYSCSEPKDTYKAKNVSINDSERSHGKDIPVQGIRKSKFPSSIAR